MHPLRENHRDASRSAFTLIELLVVIAIIAILAVVVVLTLNPAELLRQSRDSTRVSDMSTLTSALGLYNTDQGSASSFNLGSSSVVYVSIPDPSATSTAGDQCQGLGLIFLPSSYSYHCAASSTYKNTNGQGWIPVNFSLISSGSPLGNLPVDPTNQSSSRFYYTYVTNGTNYEVTSAMESIKYGVGGSGDVISNDGGSLASVYEKGSKLGLEPLDYGDPTLVGYWPLTEGTGTVAYDYSGNNNSGTWSGTKIGSNGYYTTNAKVGPYAGDFDGSSTYITTGITNLPNGSSAFSEFAWINIPNSSDPYPTIYAITSTGGTAAQLGLTYSGNAIRMCIASSCYTDSRTFSYGTWVYVGFTFSGGATGGTIIPYLNGVASTPGTVGAQNISGTVFSNISANPYEFLGTIDDVRVYNRALSAAQITGMYNGGK